MQMGEWRVDVVKLAEAVRDGVEAFCDIDGRLATTARMASELYRELSKAQAQATADNSAMDATKLREAFMAGRLSQVCQIEQELAFSEFMARRRHQ